MAINPNEAPVTDDYATRVAKLLAQRLIERRDAKAIQHPNGSYSPARSGGELEPLRLADLVDHVERRRTIGHYLVSADNTCRIFAFDIDLVKASREVWAGPTSDTKRDLAMQMASMAEELAIRTADMLNLPVTVSYSGSKGMHVIGLLEPGTSAEDARSLAQVVLNSFDGDFELYKGKNFYRHKIVWEALEVELFPKQEEVRPGDGLGNLLRLPLGINQKTGKESWFLDLSEPACNLRKLDPEVALTRGSL